MATLKHSIKIKNSPKAIFDFFRDIARNYKKWHPDHINAKWLKGRNFEKGSVLYAEERLGGKIEKLRFKTTKCEKNKILEYKLLFPESIICSGGSFTIRPANGGSIFTATLSFRLGSILAKLFPSKQKALKKHMKEESENLKKLLEN